MEAKTASPKQPAVKQAIIRLTPQQAEFVRAKAPRVAMIGGRGSGKTWAGAYRLLRWARPGCTYLVVAPTYTMLRDFAWPTMIGIARQTRQLRAVHPSRMSLTITAQPCGQAQVLFRTADRPDRLRGLSVAGCWLDEASLMPQEVYEVVMFTLRQQPGAWLAATFTPKGLRHWTYQRFGQPGADCVVVHAPTRTNLFLPKDFLETVSREAAGRLAQQELEGLFVSLDGAEWPPELWSDWVWVQPDKMPRLDEYLVRVVAVDPSLGKKDKPGDYSAIVFLGVARDLLWVAADLQRRPPYQIVQDTIRACDRWKPQFVGIEANQFQQLLVHEFERQTAGRFGIAWPTFQIDNRVPKLVRIRRLGQYISRRELRVLDDPGGRLLVGQLMDFPHGPHDDGPDALEMAIRLVLELAGGSYHDELGDRKQLEPAV